MDKLLQFSGEQDIVAFGKVCEAIEDMMMEESGGSREYCIKVDNGKIVICNKSNQERGKRS